MNPRQQHQKFGVQIIMYAKHMNHCQCSATQVRDQIHRETYL